jgi:hypothetical protein
VSIPTTQLLSYSFGADASFEGQLVGALERIESGGALRILDALFVQADAQGGEMAAVSLRGDGAGSIVAPLLGFRLDAAERRRLTEKTMSERSRGISPDTIRELASTLEPGAAIAAVLVDHVWLRALQDAGARGGGRLISNEFLEAGSLSDVDSSALTD